MSSDSIRFVCSTRHPAASRPDLKLACCRLFPVPLPGADRCEPVSPQCPVLRRNHPVFHSVTASRRPGPKSGVREGSFGCCLRPDARRSMVSSWVSDELMLHVDTVRFALLDGRRPGRLPHRRTPFRLDGRDRDRRLLRQRLVRPGLLRSRRHDRGPGCPRAIVACSAR